MSWALPWLPSLIALTITMVAFLRMQRFHKWRSECIDKCKQACLIDIRLLEPYEWRFDQVDKVLLDEHSWLKVWMRSYQLWKPMKSHYNVDFLDPDLSYEEWIEKRLTDEPVNAR